jgi:SCF-associated factor 1
MGTADTGPLSPPDLPRDLQHRSVISLTLGDYHRGALTSTGALMSWGAYSEGALGLGDPRTLPVGAPGGYATDDARARAASRDFIYEPPAVEAPAKVGFGAGGRKFVFAATMGGWHSGALVLNLEVRVQPARMLLEGAKTP